jgi:hypothetical protein
VYQFQNFVIAGDTIVVPDEDVGIKRVADLRIDGQPLADLTDAAVLAKLRIDVGRFKRYSQFEGTEARSAEIITDQNMITEYRHNPVMNMLTQNLMRSIVGDENSKSQAEAAH